MPNYFLFKRDEKKAISNKDHAAVDTANELCGEVIDMWGKSKIPSISKQEVILKFLDYHKQYRNILK